MKFRILGPLEIEESGRLLTPSGHTARALLTLLLVHPNEPIAGERLVEEIWGERIPANPLKALQIQISRLRKALGSEWLTTIGGGYSVVIAEGELDRDRATYLVDAGRDHLDARDPERARENFREALSLFRGRPLEEFAYANFARAGSALLEELRLQAEEGLFEAELALGRGARIVGGVEALVAEHPLRERLHEQRLLALYQAGRQADALEAYQEARQRLVDELGLEPGPALQALERRILNQDPTLVPKRSGRVRPPTGKRTGRRRQATLLAGSTVLAGLTLDLVRSLGVLGGRLGAARGLARDARHGDARTGSRDSARWYAQRPCCWSTRDLRGPAGARNRRRRRSADARRRVPRGACSRPTRLAAGLGGLWVLDGKGRRLALLGSSRVLTVPAARDRGPAAPLDAFATGERSVWLAERDAELVFRVDPRSGRSQPIDNRGEDSFFDGDARRAVAAAAGSVWVGNPVSVYPATDRLGRISRIDAVTGKLSASIRLPAPPVAVAADDRAIWIALDRGTDLWRIDPRDNVAAASVSVPGGVIDLAIGEGSVWAPGPGGDVNRIDPQTNAITAHANLGRGNFIAAGHGAVWVAAR